MDTNSDTQNTYMPSTFHVQVLCTCGHRTHKKNHNAKTRDQQKQIWTEHPKLA